MAVFSILSILGYAFSLFYYFKKDLELILLAVIASIIAILHLASYFSLLAHVSQLLFYVGLILFFVLIYLFYKKGELVPILSPSLFIFVSLPLLYWWFYSDMQFFYWDEFSNWGSMSIETLKTDKLLDHIPLGLTSYPRGAILFQYYIASRIDQSEGAIYLAHFILLLTPLLSLFKYIHWKNFIWIFVVLSFVFYIVYRQGLGVFSIYLDHIIGVWFASVMIHYINIQSSLVRFHLYHSFLNSTTVLLIPVLFVMPLLKDLGFHFALLSISIILFDQIILKPILFLAQNKKIFPILKQISLSKSIIVVMLVLAPFLSKNLWDLYLEEQQIGKIFTQSFSFSIDKVKEAFDPEQAIDKHRLIINKFYHVFVSGTVFEYYPKQIHQEFLNLTFNFSHLDYFLIYSFLYIIGVFFHRSQFFKLRLSFIYLALSAAFILITSGLLLKYLFHFGDYEGTRLASFHRYLNSYMIAFASIGFGFLSSSLAYSKQTIKQILLNPRLIFALPFVAFLFYTYPVDLRHFYQKREGVHTQQRERIKPQVQKIHQTIPASAKLYVIDQINYGNSVVAAMVHLARALELIPIRLTSGWRGYPYDCMTLGTAEEYTGTSDLDYACDLSVEEWQQQIIEKKSDFLYIVYIDQKFWDKYGRVFEAFDPTTFLYKINQTSSKTVKLTPVKIQ